MSETPLFSVVIPTRNRRERLLRCLRSLEGQSLPLERFEVIVADDGSTDDTAAAVKALRAGTPLALSLCRLEYAGPGPARNLAAGRARGEFLAFTDDDVVPARDWLERAEARLRSPALAGIDGLTQIGDGSDLRAFELPGSLGFLTSNLFLRRDVFLSSGGFDPDFCDPERELYFREDADLGFRLLATGHRIEVAHDVRVVHDPPFRSARDYFRHARRYVFDPLLYRKHPRAYREHIEVKRFGVWTLHRPFHYGSAAYLLCLATTAFAAASGHSALAAGGAAGALACYAGLLYRYERRWLPDPTHPLRSLSVALLPPIYWLWFLRGCARWRSWGAVL